MKPQKQRRLYRGPAIDRILSVSLANALARGGITTITHLVDVGVDAVIMFVPNVGERSRAALERAIEDSGIRPLTWPARAANLPPPTQG